VVDPLLDRWMAGGTRARLAAFARRRTWVWSTGDRFFWMTAMAAGDWGGAGLRAGNIRNNDCGMIFREINQDNKRERTCMGLSLANCLSCGGERFG
jgi:hypothetical protein